MPKQKVLIFGLLGIYFASVYSIFAGFDDELLSRLCGEDRIVEYLGATFLLVAALIFFFLSIKLPSERNTFFGRNPRLNIYFLLLGILFFVGFGEEISWGQRIFGWSTPDLFLDNNAQQETNLHNLWIFHATNPDGQRKSLIEMFLNFSRLFSIFWLSYGVLIPVLTTASKTVHKWVNFLGIPIPPLHISGLFVVNYISFRIVIAQPTITMANKLNELKETNFAAIFMMLSIHFLSFYLPKRLKAREATKSAK